MRLAFIELSGFRGFRDRIRLEFPAGFAVITGRNGVGKSTLCDAVEFALTGEIDKYRVERAAKESLSDYVWWRGNDAPRMHYVTIGFEDDGRIFPITRSREAAPSVSAAELEGMLCLPETKPDQALRQLCRTSIIRDEWIAALSLDLSDTERF